jgi:outer membrane protein OmpA-like peptidoglycan-associated protein
MTNPTKSCLIVSSLLSAMALAGCAWQSDVDALQSKNQMLQSQVTSQQAEIAADKTQIANLQGAIKYTVDSDLLFAPGSWKMSVQGEKIIAGFVQKLAPTQQNKLVVNGYTDNAPIGPALMKQGVASNQVLSQKRAEAVMQFLVSKGVKRDLVSAVGHGDANAIAPNTTAQGRAKNRRVELTLGSPTS